MKSEKPVLLTGASGFIARHVAVELLNAGYRVKASVRSPERAEELLAVLAEVVPKKLLSSQLVCVQLDLMSDEGWASACQGCSALIHTASPVAAAQPKDEAVLVRPAVEGTKRALGFAIEAGVRKVVVTSSQSAMFARLPKVAQVHLSESDWTDPFDDATTPYARAKTLAEKSAWDMARAEHNLRLTTILPGFVFGPAIGTHFSDSAIVVERVLTGRVLALPKLNFTVVDVRDVARLHLMALEDEAFAGQRVCAVSGALWSSEVADILHAEYPKARIRHIVAPNWAVRISAFADKPLKSLLPTLGRQIIVDQSRFRALLGREPISPKEALVAMAQSLEQSGRAGRIR